jgi:mannitol 2-dehydrogenase
MNRVDDRRGLSGIAHALKCGGRWADCAEVQGPKKTLSNRFVRWAGRWV